MQATVLSIAGSDPTGGAGIQADIKTMTSIGVYGAAVITCVTVQNSFGVKRVVPLEPKLVQEQIKAVLEDHYVTHVKTGMIGTAEISEAICTTLEGYTGELIVDPVLSSTTGHNLLRSSDIESMKKGLIKKATVLTPNLPELSAITGMGTETPEDILQAADTLLETYSNLRSVIVKGGHSAGDQDVTDLLLYRSQKTIRLISSTRAFVDTRNTHGTGCILASAYAAYHSRVADDELAFFSSTAFMQQMLEKNKKEKIITNPDGFGGLLLGPVDKD